MKKIDSVDLIKKILFFVSCLILAFVFWCVVKYNQTLETPSTAAGYALNRLCKALSL